MQETRQHRSVVLPVIEDKLTRVAQRRLVSAQYVAPLAHASRRRIVALLAVEGVFAAELLELLFAVLLGLLRGVCWARERKVLVINACPLAWCER